MSSIHRLPRQHGPLIGGLRAALLSVLLCGTVSAQALGDLAAKIPEQPLAEALAEYSRQTGMQVAYVSEIVRGKSSSTVQRGLNARLALAQLLENTGLTFELLNERSVRVFAIESATSPGPPNPPKH